jgi:hypothetical protein
MKPPDMALGRFLTRLAVEDQLRSDFESAPKATLDGLADPLRPSVKKAILERKRSRLFNLFNIANQSSGGDVPSPAKKTAKKAAKKAAKKSSAKK